MLLSYTGVIKQNDTFLSTESTDNYNGKDYGIKWHNTSPRQWQNMTHCYIIPRTVSLNIWKHNMIQVLNNNTAQFKERKYTSGSAVFFQVTSITLSIQSSIIYSVISSSTQSLLHQPKHSKTTRHKDISEQPLPVT